MKNIQLTINSQTKRNNTLNYDNFIKIIHQATNMNCENIIKIHNALKGITDSSGICKTDYDEKFIINILNYDFGYNHVKETPEELIKFFNSKHTSDYLKELINKYNNNQSLEISTLVNSDKDIKDFNQEELYLIYKLLEKYGLSEIIIALSFKLDSPGAINFLNNKVNPITLIKRIIYTSGLSARPEYYSGRGARLSDLNGQMLYSIYNKLTRLDQNKGLNMAIMTLNMNSLETTNFLEKLYQLVENNYNLEKLQLSDNNYSLGTTKNNEKENTELYTYSTSLNNLKTDDTEIIKFEFKRILPPVIVEYLSTIESINQNTYKYQHYPKNTTYKRRRVR